MCKDSPVQHCACAVLETVKGLSLQTVRTYVAQHSPLALLPVIARQQEDILL